MPLFGALGFRATGATFERARIVVRLDTGSSGAAGLIVTAWATRSSTAWRDVVNAARTIGADWCFLLSPPFLSLIDARGHASRRSVDFTLPDVLAPASFPAFWAVARAGAPLPALLATAGGFQDRVRADLQVGVADALRAFGTVVRPGAHTTRRGAHARLSGSVSALRGIARPRAAITTRSTTRRTRSRRCCREAAAGDRRAGLWDGLAAITRLSRVGCRIDDLIVRAVQRTAVRPRFGADRSKPAAQRRARRRAAPARDEAARTRAGRARAPGRAVPAARDRYADLGVEQLGAVYERVLDLDHSIRGARAGARHGTASAQAERHVLHAAAARRVRRAPHARAARRRRGRPTPSSRCASLDPAMGSGAFLVAACRYLAAAYERALIDEGRCAETDLDDRRARRTFAG